MRLQILSKIVKSLSTTTIVFGATVLGLTLSSVAHAESFCGRVRGITYMQKSEQLESFMYLDMVRGYRSYATLSSQKLVVTDAEANLKIAKVIAELSTQNSEKLKQDLLNKNFDWYYLVGEELAPNPYEESFEVCLEANLDALTQTRELKKVDAVLDVLEDGHSVKDLLD